MGKVAFVFSGQGDQKVGMCRDLYDSCATFRSVMDSLEAVHPGLIDSIYNSTTEELMKTINTQPALYAVEVAIARQLEEMGVKSDVVAGFSLGEISALAIAGAFSVEEGMKIVSARAAYMQEEASKVDAVMTACLRLSEEDVREIASHYGNVYPVNFNCPGQIVCSGAEDEIKAFEEEVKEKGGRCLRLSVKGAFHSPFMAKASENFAAFLEGVEIKDPEVPAYSNYLGQVYQDGLKEKLALQIKSPVLWQKSVEDMIAKGVDRFVEIGPGTTLSSIIKKISKEVETYASGNAEALTKTVEALSC